MYSVVEYFDKWIMCLKGIKMIDQFELQKDSSLINSYLIKHNTHPIDEYVEFAWNPALFFAKIILASQNNTTLNENSIQTEIAKYNQVKGTNVSLDFLLNRFWLRKVLGQIKISASVLRLFLVDEIVEIPEEINDDELIENFRFMCFLIKKYKYEDSRTCEIPADVFGSIYAEFRNFYPKMPKLDTLLQDYLITKENEKYVFVLWRLEQNFKKSFLSAYILYSLFQNSDPSQDAKILKEWLVATRFIFCPEAFESLSEWYKERYVKTALELLRNELDLEDGHENEKFWLNEDLCNYSNYSAEDVLLRKGLSNYTIKSKEPFVRWLKVFSNREGGVELLDFSIREDCVKLLQSLLIYTIRNPNAIDVLDLFENKSYLLYQAVFYLIRSNPAYLLVFIDDKRYGLIFFCSFLVLCEDSFNKGCADEHIPFKLINKYAVLFCEKNLICKENYHDASLLLMFLIKGMYNSRWPALHRNVYEKICSLSLFKNPTQAFVTDALDCYENNAKDIWKQRVQQIKICEFKYLFFFYTKARTFDNNQCFDLIRVLYEDSVLRNEKFNYWSEWNEIGLLEWDLFFNQLCDIGLLRDFCLSIFSYLSFDEKESGYDKKYSSPKKLRLHLKILCSVYSEWRKYESNEKVEILEECIVTILRNCFVNKIEEKKIAVFNQLYESRWGADFSTELFPQVIEVLKSFSEPNRKSVLLAMSKGDDLRLMIKAYNLIDDEEDRSFLKGLMDFSIDVEKSISFFDEYISFLQDLYKSHINNEFADKLFEKLEKLIENRAKGQIIAPFVLNAQILKLYSLFWHDDEMGLLEYKCPYVDSEGLYRDSLINLENERCFLLILMYMKKGKNDDALKIVKRIRCQDSDYFALKYKSFALYVSVFYTENGYNYAELLKECDSLIEVTNNKMGLNEKISYDGLQYLYYAKVSILEKIGDLEKLYKFYNSVEDDYRAELEFSKTVVTCLRNQGRNETAFKVCNAIRPSEKEKMEYEKLKKSIPAENEISRLASSYKDILCLSKEDRFKVLPDVVCKHRENVGSFILHSVCFCLNRILDKIHTLKQLPEDNKTDLIQITLESYLRTLNYEIDKDQPRQGLSSSKKQAGELDLVLDFDTYSVVLEAVRCDSFSQNVRDHILKTNHYDSSKRIIVNLMYYEGDNSDFLKHWEIIAQKSSNNSDVVYPQNFKCLSSKDISNEFGNASIKVLKNTHENELEFYHMFVNLSYAD